MRYLKRQTINRRIANDPQFFVDPTNAAITSSSSNAVFGSTANIVMGVTNNLILPTGTVAQRPSSPLNGMIRYCTDLNGGQVEIYQAGTWRSLRFKEPVVVTRETYTGDGSSTVYGPLNPQPPMYTGGSVQDNATWTGDNLVVIVGNVYQTWSTNYLIQTGTAIGVAPFNQGANASKYYIQFTSATPGLSTPIVILHGFDS